MASTAPALRRSITIVQATSMVVGIILGASIFIQPSEITRLVANPWSVMMVWLGAGALTLCGALICAELSAAFPDTGGVYVFLHRLFSPAAGFLWGWGMFWSVHSGIIAAIAVILARYVAYFLPMGESGIRVVAIAVVLLLSLVNYLGVKQGSMVQLVLTAAKVVAVVLMVVLLFVFGGAAHRALPIQAAATPTSIHVFALAVAAGLFSFGGWHMVTYTAGETRDPARTIPRALLLGVLGVTIVYILLNAAYLYVLPMGQVAGSMRVAAEAMERVLGGRAGGAIAILVIFSAMGALNGIILAGPRVYYAMAQDGLAFRWLGAVHPRRQTPHLAIAAQAIWTSVLVATNGYRQLVSRVVYTEWIFFALLAVGLFLLRRRAESQPRWLTHGYPWWLTHVIGGAFVVTSLGIVINQVQADPRGAAFGLGFILLGLPIYFLWSHQLKTKDGRHS